VALLRATPIHRRARGLSEASSSAGLDIDAWVCAGDEVTRRLIERRPRLGGAAGRIDNIDASPRASVGSRAQRTRSERHRGGELTFGSCSASFRQFPPPTARSSAGNGQVGFKGGASSKTIESWIGQIGRAVAQRAVAFEMRCIGHDRSSPDRMRDFDVEPLSLDDLLRARRS